ncbi:hypothetical protein EDD16DRAFT_829838 [Pisolithus croceorrhizus]|nr:hypothetical protein EDD16DRAFT_829838 [Pisolithus croceorrhizus]KAI6135514.1 hypothetical protein EV401DRAFT_540688 [Pisolithus croceorrhizus]
MMSRLWRNVVSGTPKLWSEIVLTGDQPLSIASLETQLRRSCEVPLNIIIMNWSYEGSEGIRPWLDFLFSSANRWQCLHIFDVNYGLANIFHTIEVEGLEFPSLKDVHVDIRGESTYLRSLLPNRVPALRNLELLNFVPSPEFIPATTLTTLHLTFNTYLSQTIITPIPLIIPALSLTILSLTGCTTGWVLPPDCIHLPLLEVLILAIDNPQRFMQIIVAPKLMCFECSSYDFQRKLTNFGTGSKFNHVRTFTPNAAGVDAEGGDALCQEFCGVRHVNLHATAILALCTREAQLGDSDSVPVDHLTSLETLTIHGLSLSYPQQFDFLVRWLTKRLKLGQPRLSVRLSGVSSQLMDGAELVSLCNKLQSCSILEVDDIDLRSSAHCSTSNGLLQLDLRGTDPFVADDIFLASFRKSAP